MSEKNIRLTISFVGTAYCGFQVQKGQKSICSAVQDAIACIFGVRADVKGCSRTDSGVHARRFCLNFHVETALAPPRIAHSLNAVLPRDISVLQAEEMPPHFHARYDCKGKRYVYKIWNSPARNPFLEGRAYHYFRPLSVEQANAVCALFVGTHNFKAFCGKKNTQEDTVRTITCCFVRRTEELVEFVVEGDGFLYNMVRILVGSVLAVNEGRLLPQQITAAFKQGLRRVECRTMPACGLYLDEVFYDDGNGT